jgi:hypothetical protein
MGYKSGKSPKRSRKNCEKRVKSYVRSNGVRVKSYCISKKSQTSKKSPKKSQKKSYKKSPKTSRTKAGCNEMLKNKIATNMKEYKEGRFSSRQQAIAVSYSQVKKASPHCKRYFKQSRK